MHLSNLPTFVGQFLLLLTVGFAFICGQPVAMGLDNELQYPQDQNGFSQQSDTSRSLLMPQMMPLNLNSWSSMRSNPTFQKFPLESTDAQQESQSPRAGPSPNVPNPLNNYQFQKQNYQRLLKTAQQNQQNQFKLKFLLNRLRPISTPSFSTTTNKRNCFLNAGMSHNCDFKELLSAVNARKFWESSQGPGKRRKRLANGLGLNEDVSSASSTAPDDQLGLDFDFIRENDFTE